MYQSYASRISVISIALYCIHTWQPFIEISVYLLFLYMTCHLVSAWHCINPYLLTYLLNHLVLSYLFMRVVKCLSVLHITVSLLRLYFDLCLFSCLFTLIVVFVIYCFVLPIVANKDLQ